MLLLAILLTAAAPDTGPVRVLAAGATESTLRAVAAEYEHRTGRALQLGFGAVGQLRDRVLSGEDADLVIVTPAIVEQLEAKAVLRPGTRIDLGRVGGGIAVPRGSPSPAVGTPEELRKALLGAAEIYLADPATATAGAYFLTIAERLGIADEVRPRIRSAPGGKEAMQQMARASGRAIGVTQISEILAVPEVTLVGPYPEPFQRMTTYAGVIPARAQHPEAARDLLRFLTTDGVQASFRKAGFER
jgi:molybdate transport system substrate-binding protein